MTISKAEMTHDAGQEAAGGRPVLTGKAAGGEDITLAQMTDGAWSYSAVGDRWIRAGLAPTLDEAFAAINDHLRLRIAPGVTSAARASAAQPRAGKRAARAVPAAGHLFGGAA